MMKMKGAGTHKDNIMQIAAWWSFKPAWRWLLKHINDDKCHFLYFQSSEDAIAKWKFIDKIKAKYPNAKHARYLEKGYHILSKEEPANKVMFDMISEDVNQQHEK
jgi:alpha-beta hydrolase superfamily lysophospholipase